MSHLSFWLNVFLALPWMLWPYHTCDTWKLSWCGPSWLNEPKDSLKTLGFASFGFVPKTEETVQRRQSSGLKGWRALSLKDCSTVRHQSGSLHPGLPYIIRWCWRKGKSANWSINRSIVRWSPYIWESTLLHTISSLSDYQTPCLVKFQKFAKLPHTHTHLSLDLTPHISNLLIPIISMNFVLDSIPKLNWAWSLSSNIVP